MSNVEFFLPKGSFEYYHNNRLHLRYEHYENWDAVPIGAVGWWGPNGYYKLGDEELIWRNYKGEFKIISPSETKDTVCQENAIWFA